TSGAASARKGAGVLDRAAVQGFVDVPSRDEEHDGSRHVGAPREESERGGGGAFRPDAGPRVCADRLRDLALRDETHVVRDAPDPLDRRGDRDPYGEPVGERVLTAAGNGAARAERALHHGRRGGGDAYEDRAGGEAPD